MVVVIVADNLGDLIDGLNSDSEEIYIPGDDFDPFDDYEGPGNGDKDQGLSDHDSTVISDDGAVPPSSDENSTGNGDEGTNGDENSTGNGDEGTSGDENSTENGDEGTSDDENSTGNRDEGTSGDENSTGNEDEGTSGNEIENTSEDDDGDEDQDAYDGIDPDEISHFISNI